MSKKDAQNKHKENKPKNEAVVKFGKAVRSRREAMGISQENLAYKAGVNRTYIGTIERGEKSVTVASIVKIAKALDVTAAEIFQDAEL
jgi:transcriptional regulator with XRE-family HTH domain